MRKLSTVGEHSIAEWVQRHGFSRDAVMNMLEAVSRGNATMAQFDHPEFGGSGQWMGGGMIMVSDMFNDALKARVAALAADIAKRVADEAAFAQGTPEDQTQHGSADAPGPSAPASLVIPPAAAERENWWPAALGTPASHGAQNGVRYAYFAAARILAIELNEKLTLYDTLDHRIGSFSQQQSRGGSLTFHSQQGLVDLAELPVVSGNGAQRRD